ncbi:MAG: hypothetical protein HUU28_11360 [Planctomycetaceae bacterium]|nr:hypothetical protein [Planctomycetaceae bacterium]
MRVTPTHVQLRWTTPTPAKCQVEFGPTAALGQRLDEDPSSLRGSTNAGSNSGIGFANNPNAPVTQQADIGITLDTGAEVISGSTRLKAGTAQKIALNTLSSSLMVRLHKVHGNLMVDVDTTKNAKLVERGARIVSSLTGVPHARALELLREAKGRVKLAVLMHGRRCTLDKAQAALDAAGGSLRKALEGS